MPNCLDEITVLAYNTQCTFSDISLFQDALLKLEPALMQDIRKSSSLTFQLVSDLSNKLKKVSSVYDHVGALAFCLEKDLKEILTSHSPINIKDWDVDDALHSFAEKAIRQYSLRGLNAPKPHIEVVDEFPEPFSKMSWEAFCPDASDAKQYGIKPGIYFLRNQAEPLLSEILVAHELVHYYAGKNNSELLGRGLEDGLAELLGSLFIGRKLFGETATKNIYRNEYLLPEMDSFYQVYVDYTRIAIVLLLNYGLNYLFSLISSGRKSIKEAENAIFLKGIESLSQNKVLELSPVERNFLYFVENVLETYIRTLVVNPLDYRVSQFVKPGSTIDIICTSSGFPHVLVEEALDRLQTEVFIVLSSKERVQCSDTEMLLNNKMLRYEIPEGLIGKLKIEIQGN